MIEISSEELKSFQIIINDLKEKSITGLENHNIDLILNILKNAIDFSSYLSNKRIFDRLERVTINKNLPPNKNKRITQISFLKYPPAEYVSKYGRANLPKQSVLYATFDGITTLNEMKPSIGDLITTSTWKLKDIHKNTPLNISPIFKKWELDDKTINLDMYNYNQEFDKRIKNYPSNLRAKINILNEFIAHEFTKIVDRNYHENYLFSAYFANEILYRFKPSITDAIDAIYYPSVQTSRATNNLAIKPNVFDNLYELASVKESIVISKRDKGYYLEGICSSKTIDAEKKLVIWKETFTQPPEHIELFKSKYGYET